MKLILLISTLISISQVNAASFLTEAQSGMVLEVTDNICGDSWCEGDYDYSFNKFSCNSFSNSCDLTFEYISYSYDEVTYETIGEERVEVTCKIENLTSYDQMVEIRSNYEQVTQDFYDRVDICIEKFYSFGPEVH